MAKASKKKATSGAERKPKTPRDVTLTGMEDSAIKPIEDAALAFVEVRDERMQLTEQEVALKAKLMKVMHQHNKTVYRRGDIEVRMMPVDETVKVRVRRSTEEK